MAGDTICISHATGALGREVGRLVAEQLRLRYVDEEVISEAADWAELDPSLVADAERRKPLVARILGASAAAPMRLPSGDTGRSVPTDADLRDLIRTAVTRLAGDGGVVMVAHAASFAIADARVVRVLVTASPAVRSERLASERGIAASDAERAIRDEDAGRADYLKRFYDVQEEHAEHYDLVVNTDRVSPAVAADAVAAVLRGRA
jgi:cytidylate kinase